MTISLTNFRLDLLRRMTAAGHEVIAFAPENDDIVMNTLKSIGVRFIRISMNRTGTTPVADVRTLFSLWRYFRRLKPDTILPYTMKPIIYGCLAARLARIPHRFALITGLGYIFTDPKPSWPLKVIRRISILLYRLALKGAERVFVYNAADAAAILRIGLVRNSSAITLVPGSGVNIEHYRHTDPPPGPPTFLLVARLLRDKGIIEYVEAARRLRRSFPEIRIQLLGPFDSNPSGISQAEVANWVQEGVVEYLGETRDVRPFLAQCTVFVLPSYREGISRSILEAMATGRAIITTDAPGCCDTVAEGENGRLVPPRDSAKLAEVMESFVKDPDLAIRMGRRSHEIVRQRFDVHEINRILINHMGLLDESCQSVR